MSEFKEQKKREKLHLALDKARGVSGEPLVGKDNYRSELGSALNWYNTNVESKVLRKHAIAYVNQLKLKDYLYAVGEASDFELRQIGIVGRLISREQYVAQEHIDAMQTKLNILKNKYVKDNKATVVETKTTVGVSVQDRIQEAAYKHIWDIDDAIDTFIKTKSSDFSAKSYLLSNAVSGAVAKKIGEYYGRLSAELAEAVRGKDEQLEEGYSYFTKAQLKKFQAFIDGIILECSQQVVSAKAARAPRPKKVKPASVQVAKMKYLKEFPELNLKSVSPIDIIGASEVWVYNTKYRRVTVYKADAGLAVKGTTLLGYTVSGSETRSLRKPEEFFKTPLKKKELGVAFKKLTTKPSEPNGRINEDTIILGIFK